MKKKIHPKWYPQAKVTCACGHTFTVGSTTPTIEVEICAACHPFFTGEARYIDTMGRVEKFQARQKTATTKKYVKKKDRQKIKAKKKDETPRTLKEMLKGQ